MLLREAADGDERGRDEDRGPVASDQAVDGHPEHGEHREPADQRDEGSGPRGSRFWWGAVSVGVLGALIYARFIIGSSWVVGGRRQFTLFDDAMISMSYARTGADGHGFVWFPGAPPIEGYTNPLWTWLMAGVHALPLDGGSFSLVVMILSAAILLATVAAAAAIATMIGGRRSAGWVTALVVITYFPLQFWALRGMETGLVALALAVLVWSSLRCSDRDDLRAVIAGAAAAAVGVATRLDFLFFVPIVLVWLAVVRRPSNRRLMVGVASATGATLVVVGGLQQLWYGSAIPNTVTLKLAGVELGTRLHRGSTALLLTFLLALVPVVVLLAMGFVSATSGARRNALLPVALTVGALTYSVWIGGDAWEDFAWANRFVASVVPVLLATAIGVCVSALEWGRGKAFRIALVSVPLIAGVIGIAIASRTSGVFEVLLVVVADLRDRLWTTRAPIVVVTALVVLAVVIAIAIDLPSRTGRARPRAPSWIPLVGIGTVLACFAGFGGLEGWLPTGGKLVVSDQTVANYGRLLHDITDDDATIATVMAGAPIYYSQRKGIDLLGKSDRHVAESSRHTDGIWRPGHDRWDYVYSIVEQRPDVVAQLWHYTRDERAAINAAGYEVMTPKAELAALYHKDATLLSPGILVRRDSPHVRRDLLDSHGPIP